MVNSQLGNYINNMLPNLDFSWLNGIDFFVQKFVEKKKDKLKSLVYLLLTLALTLLITTTRIERSFSTINTKESVVQSNERSVDE